MNLEYSYQIKTSQWLLRTQYMQDTRFNEPQIKNIFSIRSCKSTDEEGRLEHLQILVSAGVLEPILPTPGPCDDQRKTVVKFWGSQIYMEIFQLQEGRWPLPHSSRVKCIIKCLKPRLINNLYCHMYKHKKTEKANVLTQFKIRNGEKIIRKGYINHINTS